MGLTTSGTVLYYSSIKSHLTQGQHILNALGTGKMTTSQQMLK